MDGRLNADDGPRYLTVAQAAAELVVAPDKVYAWIRKGLIRHFREPGAKDGSRGRKNIRIRRDDWQAFLDANTGTARPQGDQVVAARTTSAVDGETLRRRLRRRVDDDDIVALLKAKD